MPSGRWSPLIYPTQALYLSQYELVPRFPLRVLALHNNNSTSSSSSAFSSRDYKLSPNASSVSLTSVLLLQQHIPNNSNNSSSSQEQACYTSLFPLHLDVLAACVRQLMIVRGDLEVGTWRVVSPAAMGNNDEYPPYVQYNDKKENEEVICVDRSNKMIKKCKERSSSNDSSDFFSAEKYVEQFIIEAIVKSGFVFPLLLLEEENSICNDIDDSISSDNSRLGGARKVSEDFSAISDRSSSITSKSKEFVKFYSKWTSKLSTDDSSSSKEIKLTLSDEEMLKSRAAKLMKSVLSSFDMTVLREFLGYTRPISHNSQSRENLENMITSLIFHSSHAMFAWEYTEGCLSNGLDAQSREFGEPQQQLDTKVYETLFTTLQTDNSRLLELIGGFEESSILPNALLIRRLRAREVSWHSFANVFDGRIFLSSASPAAILHGLNKRANKMNTNKKSKARRRLRSVSVTSSYSGNAVSISSIRGIISRSRSSSIVSDPSSHNDKIEIDSPANNNSNIILDSGNINELLVNMPSIIKLSTTRKSLSDCWGFSFAREGNMCVIDEAKEMRYSSSDDISSCLLEGDVLISIANEEGRHFEPPFNERYSSESSPQWFSNILFMLEHSLRLNMIIQRVSSCQKPLLEK